MKRIVMPELKSAAVLTPLEMNNIHFGGNVSPVTSEKLKNPVTQQKRP